MKYNTLEELRGAHRIKALRYYHRVKDDPEFKEKRSKRDKERYAKKKLEIKNEELKK